MASGVYVGRTRHPMILLLLGLVTAFVYTFYWVYAANTEMKKRGLTSAKPALLATLAVFPIAQAFALHRTVANLRKVYLANNVARDPSSWSISMLALPFPYLGLLAGSMIVQSGLNHVWQETRDRVIQDGPDEKDLQCPECEAIFEIRKNPYTEAIVQCPSCSFEGVL